MKGPVGPQLQRDAGKVIRHLLQPDHSAPEGRIVNDKTGALHLNQHHEVIHIPVQYAGRFQLIDFVDVQGQGARLQLDLRRDLRDRPQGRALGGNAESLPQAQHIHIKPVIGGDHGEARQAAFR